SRGRSRLRQIHTRHAELVSASIAPHARPVQDERWTLKQVQGDETWRASSEQRLDAGTNFIPCLQRDLDLTIPARNRCDGIGSHFDGFIKALARRTGGDEFCRNACPSQVRNR